MPFWKRKSKVLSKGRNDLATSSSPASASSAPSKPSAAPAQNPFQTRGDELFSEGDYENAAFMYSEAARQGGNNANASLFMQLALTQLMCAPPKLDDALVNVESAIKRNPGDGHAQKLKGDICQQNGDYFGAEQAYRVAIPLLTGLDKVRVQESLVEARTKQRAPPPNLAALQTIPQQMPPPQIITPPQVNTLPQSPTHIPAQSVSPPISPSTNAQLSPQTTTTGTTAPPRASTPSPENRNEAPVHELNIPREPPPSYTPNVQQPLGMTTDTALTQALRNLEVSLATNKDGAVYLSTLVGEGQIDIIFPMFHGKTIAQAIFLDAPLKPPAHASWKNYHVDGASHPGTNFLDYDCETANSYDGYHTGTTTILGYTEEYRTHQLTLRTQLNITLEANSFPPPMALDEIVRRINLLQLNPTLEDNAKLSQILGMPRNFNATTRTAIEDICMSFHRAQYDAPGRFIDFLTTDSFSKHMFGAAGVGLANFLFHILLGAELALRMKKMGSQQKYPNIVKTTTSALVVISRLFMENVTVRSRLQGASYILGPQRYLSQTEGLLRFAEAIQWPYMDEARSNLESLYSQLISLPSNVHNYLKDWLYGLVLPGKFFRHRILSCLVLACPSTKNLSFAPFYSSGLVLGNKSYWPKLSVLGRVLGGLENSKSTCGWVGPLPSPVGHSTSWVSLHTRRVNFVTPVVDDLTQTNLEILGFSESELDMDPAAFVTDASDLNKWKPPVTLPPRSRVGVTAESTVTLKRIKLNEVSSTGATVLITTADQSEYRAVLTFDCHGKDIDFTLYSNPVFVHVPKCQGASHPIHDRLVKKLLTGLVLAKDLKNGATIPSHDTMLIIDAREPGEEAMARAWCSETGRHAVVRKAGIGCFTCATNLTAKRTGLAFNVLIWCS